MCCRENYFLMSEKFAVKKWLLFMVKKNSGEFTLSHLEMDFEPLFNFQKCD